MSVLDLAEEFSPEETGELVEGITFGNVSMEREERLRELIEAAPSTLREDAIGMNPAFGDLEEALGFTRSTPPPAEPEPVEDAIRERTQAEREARDAVQTLIEANMDDAEVLANLARVLERVDADESGSSN